MKQRLFRTLVMCVIGVCIGAVIGLITVVKDRADNKLPASTSRPIAGASSVGGPYELVDQDGKTRTEKDFLHTYKLIYFGFSYCPAICPTELQKIARVMRELPQDIQQKIQPIFISVDPERDTPAVLKNYVPMFDDRLIGLTGSVAQVEAAKKAYKVYSAKVPQGDDYTIDHSSYIYFMTPDDQMVYIFKTEDSAAAIAEKLLAYFSSL